MINLHTVILAAGKGTRMRSTEAKVLTPLAGKPLIHHVLETALTLNAEQTHVVFGFQGEQVQQSCKDFADVHWVEQAEQLGTGHAAAQALKHIPDDAIVLVLYGDVPLVRTESLEQLIEPLFENVGVALLNTFLDDPSGYGRIIRDKNEKIIAIVEDKDLPREYLHVNEVWTGVMAATAKHFKSWTAELTTGNEQQEYYLTNIIEMAVEGRVPLFDHSAPAYETIGINSGVDLTVAESNLRWLRAMTLADSGVRLSDPSRIDIRGTLECGQDVYIDINCIFEGNVVLEDNVNVGPGCILKNVHIEEGRSIGAYTTIDGSV